MALVCPESVADEYSDVRHYFLANYQNCRIVPFPEGHRRFNEVIVFGQKRVKPLVEHLPSWKNVEAPDTFIYRIPASYGPKTFKKTEPTESELQSMLTHSSLRSHLAAAPPTPLPAPPLALGIGHV